MAGLLTGLSIYVCMSVMHLFKTDASQLISLSKVFKICGKMAMKQKLWCASSVSHNMTIQSPILDCLELFFR